MKRFKLLFLLIPFVGISNATVYYVSPTGDNSAGLTWTNAFQTIQTATTTATSGDEIWVKQGTYVIADLASQLNIKEGVNVYGGFVGNETLKTDRNTDPTLTIISHKVSVASEFRLLNSADLNVETTWDGFTFDGKNASTGVKLSGNCTLHNSIVKNCMSTNGSGVGVYMSSASELTPLVLSNTKVIGNTLKVSSASTTQKGGAGIYVSSGSKLAEISNCEISNNTIEGISASGNLFAMGGGIYIYEGVVLNCKLDNNKLINSANASYKNNYFTAGAIAIVPEKIDLPANNVLIEGCIITNSSSPSRGGAIIIDPRWSGQYHGNYTISKTIISNNKSLGDVGGGILATCATAQTGEGWTLNILNSVISNNSSGPASAAGGICINIGCVLNITNSTVVKNFAGNYGGGGLFMPGPASHTINATIKNSLFWGNECPGRASNEVQVKISEQAATMIFSAVQSYEPTAAQYNASTFANNINLNADNAVATGPGFVAPTTIAGYGATDALTANWKLTSSSVCVDAGDDVLADDILGTARPSGDYSDIGAYEYVAGPYTKIEKIETNFNIFATKGALVVDNQNDLEEIQIYNIMGSQIKTVKAQKGLNFIELPSNQLYIVKAGNTCKKVIL